MTRKLTAFLVAGLVLGALPSPTRAQEAKTVLTIHGGPSHFPGTEALDKAIRDGLHASSAEPVNYFAEYLESEELTAETASNALHESIRLKFAGRHVDVLIANTVPAVEFALRLRDDLFPGVPIVSVAAAIPDTPGITGIVRSVAIRETLELALTLHPSVRQVFVVAYAPAVAGYFERVKATLQSFSGRVELIYLQEPTAARMVAAVNALPRDSLVLYTRYSPVDTPRVVYPDELVTSITAAASVPVYAAASIYIGRGIVGGMMQSNETDGAYIADITRRILAGERPDHIRLESPHLVPTFDWRQTRRWNIDAARLPAGSDIQFWTPTLWEASRPYVLGTFIVVSAQLLLIAGLLTQRARRRRAEKALLGREASLRSSYERIRQLGGRLINAQESARAAIAQDLHDDVCQRLTSVALTVDSLRGSAGTIQDPAAQEVLSELARDTRNTLEGVRRLSHDLHPETLRLAGLVPALKSHCAEIARRHGVEVNFGAPDDLGRLDDDVAVCLFRIAQEALRNGIAHGDARHFSVLLAKSPQQVELTVTDDGRGFDVSAARRQESGLGLLSMEERAHVVGGDMDIVSGRERGTTVRVRVPSQLRPSGA